MSDGEFVLLFDDPYNYKDLDIYPVLMHDYQEFNKSVGCLLLAKHRIPDPKILGMSYLSFMLMLAKMQSENGDNTLSNMIDTLKRLVFKNQDITFQIDLNTGEASFDRHYKDANDVDCVKRYSERDFEKVREIIFDMNDIEKPDLKLSKEAEEALKKAREFKQKANKHSPTLEDMIDFYHCWSGLPYGEIKNLPIRKFNNNIRKFLEMESYKIMKSAETTGFVKFKQKIEHYFKHTPKQSTFEDVKLSSEDFINKYKDFVKMN